ncbi:26S protease regulatory subunit 7 A [Histomonas meleagridis]|uniref:26S protease regulatory subunit 7-like A n=1 Tax=Histomonas meleagridis TaxID=135588 RepID=UPI00355A5FCB|nr:26S protease regulatory subunit 7 A [Histomonas meleagridis]KAH0799087.1 26S protease regulatory subunit 7-like A [Histomonas meleagridis]
MGDEEDSNLQNMDENDYAILGAYSKGPYTREISETEKDIQDIAKRVDLIKGVRESDTGLAPMNQWDFDGDRNMLATEEPLNVAQCEKALPPNDEKQRYIISISHVAKFVVGLGKNVAPSDITEGSRVGVDRRRYAIQLPLQPRIDPIVTMMQVEEKPDVTYTDVGGCSEQIEKLREIIEMPLLHPEKFETLGIDPPKGVLLYGPPGTGKTLLARAIANRTESVFIRVIGSELVQKYIGEGARMVREIFQMARSKKSCIIFFDEVDAFGGTRLSDSDSAEHEVQRTMLELITQLDGFDSRGNVKVLMATNKPNTLDPALLRPGRLDRKIEFAVPDLEGRVQIFKIHTRSMNVERGIRFDLLARLCPNATGADIRSVCTEAGIIAIRARRKAITEKDFLSSINKVIKGYAKFSATPSYMQYN